MWTAYSVYATSAVALQPRDLLRARNKSMNLTGERFLVFDQEANLAKSPSGTEPSLSVSVWRGSETRPRLEVSPSIRRARPKEGQKEIS